MKKKLILTTQKRDLLEYLLLKIRAMMRKNGYNSSYSSVGQFFCYLTLEEMMCLQEIIDRL